MGQALRPAAGRTRPTSTVETTSSKPKTVVVVDQRPPPFPPERPEISKVGGAIDSDSSAGTGGAVENVLEERDPNYDAMLNQMVGRIKSKPGGKLEMGEGKAEDHNGRMEPDRIAEKFRVDVCCRGSEDLAVCITASGG